MGVDKPLFPGAQRPRRCLYFFIFSSIIEVYRVIKSALSPWLMGAARPRVSIGIPGLQGCKYDETRSPCVRQQVRHTNVSLFSRLLQLLHLNQKHLQDPVEQVTEQLEPERRILTTEP